MVTARPDERQETPWWRRPWRDPQTRAAFLTLVCVYLATLFVFNATMFLRGKLSGFEIVHLSLPMLLEMFLDIPLYLVLRRTSSLRARIRWPILVALGMLDDLLSSIWDTTLRFWAGMLPTEYAVPSFSNGVVRAIPVNFYHVGMLLALFAFQEAYYKLRENQRRLLAAQASERGAHLAALRLQLNPHFLFNSMNALSSLVVTGRKEEAEGMIERLSEFLRTTLGADPVRQVTLAEEFDMLDVYLGIERIRFGDRLTTHLHLPGELEEVRIPPFLLQPLVENAVKYAVAPSRKPVCVTVEARRDGPDLVLRVEDDGEACEAVAGGTGIGLSNVRQRLRLEFGDAATFDARCIAGGYRALIRMPVTGAPAGTLVAA